MLFTRRAVQLSELFEKRGGTGIGGTSIEGRIPLPASDVCGGELGVQQYNRLLTAREHCVIEVGNAEGIFCSG